MMTMTENLTLAYGVAEVSDDNIKVRTEAGEYDAVVSASCVVMPHTGDTVLSTVDDAGRCYVIAVLVRANDDGAIRIGGSKPLELISGGDVEMKASGRVLIAADRVENIAESYGVTAENMQVTANKLGVLGHTVSVKLDSIKSVVRAVDNFFKRLITKSESSYRYVEEHDELQAGSKRVIVDDVLSVHTSNSVHIAENNVKIDAEQIHIG